MLDQEFPLKANARHGNRIYNCGWEAYEPRQSAKQEPAPWYFWLLCPILIPCLWAWIFRVPLTLSIIGMTGFWAVIALLDLLIN